MSARSSVGRVATTVSGIRPLPSSQLTYSYSLLPRLFPNAVPRRSLFGFGRGKERQDTIDANPLYTEYLKRKPAPPPQPITGDISSGSFIDEEGPARKPQDPSQARKPAAHPRNREAMEAALNPRPEARKRWERKMLIREIHAHGRVPKDLRIKRTERESTSKSHFFKTSVKKLAPLARQITGKPLEEALVQMRFSNKKAAKEVKSHLEHAKNEAIVRRGMGLGEQTGNKGEPVEIRTKDGDKMKITDRTTLYVDQAWVGRGRYTPEVEYRARGQANILRHPETSISVLLKEDATRVRLHEEREKRISRKKVWQQLPNRPVTAQRQYYCW
ncbi:MAG: hypothetical protein M4579_004340 [Chaenotheca gracillima]|nr:MAG: hypothetical protein M4579_004340 [Chaenotheca gracillima]